jgi:lysophospholipase L1-like esterase
VHLTAAAYALLGQSVFEAIGSRVQAGETVVCFGDSLTFGAGVQGAGTASCETYPAALQRGFDARR